MTKINKKALSRLDPAPPFAFKIGRKYYILTDVERDKKGRVKKDYVRAKGYSIPETGMVLPHPERLHPYPVLPDSYKSFWTDNFCFFETKEAFINFVTNLGVTPRQFNIKNLEK